MRIRKLTVFNVLDPRSIDTDWYIVLTLTSDRACMTADALSVIDDESVVHWLACLLRSRY